MKKVCFVINDLVGGGAERSVIKLAQEFATQGYESHIIIINNIIDYDVGDIPVHSLAAADKIPPNAFERMLDSNLLGNMFTNTIRKLMGQYKLFYSILYRSEIRQLQNKINELGPFAAVFSNLKESDFLCITAGVQNLYCFIRGDIYTDVKIKWAHDIKLRKMKQYLVLRKIRRFYKGQNLITVADELKHTTLAVGIKPASIQSIYNIYDFSKVKKLSNEYTPEEDDYIIWLGRFASVKRLDLLIDAYKLSEIPQKLLLLGHGEEEENIRQKIARDNLQGRVVIKKFNPNPYPYVKQAKALVLASDMEGLPGVLIDALILGTPVVSTSCPTGPKEILTGDLAEFLSPPGDTQALADNIRKVIDNPPTIKDEHIAKFHKGANSRKYLMLIEDAAKQDLQSA